MPFYTEFSIGRFQRVDALQIRLHFHFSQYCFSSCLTELQCRISQKHHVAVGALNHLYWKSQVCIL